MCWEGHRLFRFRRRGTQRYLEVREVVPYCMMRAIPRGGRMRSQGFIW